jgi:pheromone shutdown protein TraB
MKSTIEVILSPYCAGILNEERNQYIAVKKRSEYDAILQIAATSTDGLKKQRDHLKTLLANDQSIPHKEKKELEVILSLVEYEIAKRVCPCVDI